MQQRFLLLWLGLTLTAGWPAFSQSAGSGSSRAQILEVAFKKTTVLLFPNNIVKVDVGSEDVTARTVKIGESERILRVKANREADFTSNLHVFCDDGRIFTFQVRYAANPIEETRDLTSASATYAVAATAPTVAMLPAHVRQYAAAIADFAPDFSRPRVINNGMVMRRSGVYVYSGVLFFQFKIRNRKGIPFDIDFSRFYVRDQKTTKRSTAMEKEMKPLYVYFKHSPTIAANEEQTVVAAFDKFTISERKLFMAEFFERNGDRHLKTALKGKYLLKARPLLPIDLDKDNPIVSPPTTIP